MTSPSEMDLLKLQLRIVELEKQIEGEGTWRVRVKRLEEELQTERYSFTALRWQLESVRAGGRSLQAELDRRKSLGWGANKELYALEREGKDLDIELNAASIALDALRAAQSKFRICLKNRIGSIRMKVVTEPQEGEEEAHNDRNMVGAVVTSRAQAVALVDHSNGVKSLPAISEDPDAHPIGCRCKDCDEDAEHPMDCRCEVCFDED